MAGEHYPDDAPATGSVALLSLVATCPADPTVFAARLEGNDRVERARQAVAARARELIEKHGGRHLSGTDESVAATFGAPSEALDFAMELQRDSGSRTIKMRAAAHVDVVDRTARGAYDDMLAFTRQLLRRDGGDEVWTSNDFKNQIDHHGTERQRQLNWTMRPNCRLEGFEGRHILWSVSDESAGHV